MHSFSSSPRIHPLSQSQKETTALEAQWNTLGKNRNAHFSFRTECKRVWSCSIRSATTSGSVTPPSSSSSTRRISLRRKSSDHLSPFASQNMQVLRLEANLRIFGFLFERIGENPEITEALTLLAHWVTFREGLWNMLMWPHRIWMGSSDNSEHNQHNM